MRRAGGGRGKERLWKIRRHSSRASSKTIELDKLTCLTNHRALVYWVSRESEGGKIDDSDWKRDGDYQGEEKRVQREEREYKDRGMAK